MSEMQQFRDGLIIGFARFDQMMKDDCKIEEIREEFDKYTNLSDEDLDYHTTEVLNQLQADKAVYDLMRAEVNQNN